MAVLTDERSPVRASLLPPGSPAAGVWGRWLRRRICSEARKSVPLEQISPIRNALRPRRLPAAAALRIDCSRVRGSAGGESCLGPSQHRLVGRRRPRLPRPGGPGSGRIPSLASARAAERTPAPGRAGDAEPARGLTQPRAEQEKGSLSPGISESIFVRGRGARTVARAPRVGSRSRPCPPALGRSLPYPPVPSTPQRGGGRRAAGEQADLLAAAAKAGGSTEDDSSDPPRRLSAGAGGTERRGPESRFPQLLLRSSVLTAVPGNQRCNCHSPPPSAPRCLRPLLPLLPPAPTSPRPCPAHRPRAVRHGVTPTESVAGGSGTLSFACARSSRARPRAPRLILRRSAVCPRRLLLIAGAGPSAALPAAQPAGLGPERAGLWGRCLFQGQVGEARAAPEAKRDAGLGDPGFRRSARHSFLCVTVHCEIGSARESRARMLQRVSAPVCEEISFPECGDAPTSSFFQS